MNSKNYEELNHYILDSFTKGGTPLPTMLGSKQEWMTTVIAAGLLANEKISAAIDAEGIVDAAITYVNIIQERLGHYQSNQVSSLNQLLSKTSGVSDQTAGSGPKALVLSHSLVALQMDCQGQKQSSDS